MPLTKINREPLIDCEVDWEKAIAAFSLMDSLDNYPEGFQGRPLSGTPIVRILADYASLAHHCSWSPETQKLAVVVWPPEVFFCPSLDGVHGAFVQLYDEQVHGKYTYKITKPDMNIWDFSNINAMCDGWAFNAAMVFAGMSQAKD